MPLDPADRELRVLRMMKARLGILLMQGCTSACPCAKPHMEGDLLHDFAGSSRIVELAAHENVRVFKYLREESR
jgi:hypothetical protein